MLSDREIAKHCLHSDLIKPFDEACLQPCSYDLHLAPDMLIEDTESIDKNEPLELGEKPWRKVMAQDGRMVLYPGQFALGRTTEVVKLPFLLCGFIHGRSSWGRMGIMVHVTAGLVDPGFNGTLTLELVNVGRTPVALNVGERIAQICFYHLDKVPLNSYGSERLGSLYQGQLEVTPARSSPPD